ncbi:MAG: DUF4331 domain-containing protein [Acidobacteriota bacterium]|nr:DUF4331 domain-containing protein [Acidobacteriota bacterium]
MKNFLKRKIVSTAFCGSLLMSICLSLAALPSRASSHAEAPLISMDRFADNTDVYAFRSSESGREGFVTLISNFIPLQEPSGGPQFFRFDDTVLYEIKIDNTGDGIEDITYQFQFNTQIVNANTVLGMNTVNQEGAITSLNDPDYNMPQTYTVRRIDRLSGRRGRIIAGGLRTPPSNIGPRVTPNYEQNLGQPAVYNLSGGGRVFAGQRDEGFFLDLGVFDAINYRSLSASGGVDSLRNYNVNTIALEVPIQDLTVSRAVPSSPTAADAVIGVWSTASRRSVRVINANGTQNSEGAWVQVSRLGNPLVNEVVIPLGLKDAFNSLSPQLDAVAAPAILDPEFPKIVRYALGAFNGIAINIPPAPRSDLVAIFATGIPAGAVPGLPNYTTFLSDGQPHEYLRLNVAIAPVGTGSTGYSRLGLLGGDIGGFPNGRRVGDDVVDIAVRAALGGTPFTPATNVPPNNSFGDGVSTNEQPYLARFPYLAPPNPGNTPRPANSPAQRPARQQDALPFIVDETGSLLNNFKLPKKVG